MTDRTRPALQLAADAFRVEDTLVFEGRPCSLFISGQWTDDGTCEIFTGLTALAPLDFCRLVLAVSYGPDRGLDLARVTEPDDPRDDAGVIERHFGKPVDDLVGIIARTLNIALTEASNIRAERIPGETPVRRFETAPAVVH